MTRISSRSRAIWRSNSSRWLCMLMYSPAAIENAPARRPATPARTMRWLSVAAPAKPITSDRLLTSPSLAPKMAARSVPDRLPLVPRLLTGARHGTGHHAGRSLRALQLTPDRGVLTLVGSDGGRLGRQLVGVGLLLVTLECLDQVGDRAGAETARQADDQPDACPRPAGAAARWRRRLPAAPPRCWRDAARWWRCARRPRALASIAARSWPATRTARSRRARA